MLTAALAWRYLLSKKSHGAVGTISTVSVCAMAVATAAIICVLSVFNGFRDVIASKLDSLSPDVMVTPVKGKTFADAEKIAAKIENLPEVAIATPTLSDNALVIANSQEMPVTVKGVDPEQFARVTSVRETIGKDYGSYITTSDATGNTTSATIAIGVASRLRTYPDDKILIFAPRRIGRVNLANPASSFLTDSLSVSGIYRTDQSQYDEDGVIMPIEAVRDLLQYDTEASAIEIKVAPGVSDAEAAKSIAALLGNEYLVRDRLRQQEMNFRMVSIEKWVSFLLLGFILLIASFNIISSLSMLVLDKENALATFSAMGMSKRGIGAIFAWESIYVALAGGLAGIALGVTLSLIQQHFGLIKIGADPSAAVIQAYPVRVAATDIFATLVPIAVIGLITALVTARFAQSRTKV